MPAKYTKISKSLKHKSAKESWEEYIDKIRKDAKLLRAAKLPKPAYPGKGNLKTRKKKQVGGEVMPNPNVGISPPRKDRFIGTGIGVGRQAGGMIPEQQAFKQGIKYMEGGGEATVSNDNASTGDVVHVHTHSGYKAGK